MNVFIILGLSILISILFYLFALRTSKAYILFKEEWQELDHEYDEEYIKRLSKEANSDKKAIWYSSLTGYIAGRTIILLFKILS